MYTFNLEFRIFMKKNFQLITEQNPMAESKLSTFDSEKEIILTKAKSILEKCTSLKILIQKLQKFESKTKIIIKNFECKLESYIKSENKRLVERDQQQYIAQQQRILNDTLSKVDYLRKQINILNGQALFGSNEQNIMVPASEKVKTKISLPFNDNLQVLMTFTELQSLKYNPNAQYFTKGNYILESYQDSTKIYKVLDNNRIIFCEHLSILTRLFTAIDDDKFVINYQIYSADNNGTLRVLHNLETFIFRDPFCICSFDNKVFYCHSNISKIFVYDLMTNKKVITHLRKGNTPRNIGIRCLTSVPGLKNYILFLEKGQLFKAQLDYHSQQQDSVEYVYSSKGAKILSSFKVLPDNIHVVAMDNASNFIFLDHFTCEIIHQVHIKAYDFYIHPSFTIQEYPLILIQESKSSQVKALSIGDDQCIEVKRWDVRVIGNLKANYMLAVDQENKFKIAQICQ